MEADLVSSRNENEKLTRELSYARNMLEQMTAKHERAVSNMVENYQAAERGRTECLREKENIHEKLTALKFVAFLESTQSCITQFCY